MAIWQAENTQKLVCDQHGRRVVVGQRYKRLSFSQKLTESQEITHAQTHTHTHTTTPRSKIAKPQSNRHHTHHTSAGTRKLTVDPRVATVLIGHSSPHIKQNSGHLPSSTSNVPHRSCLDKRRIWWSQATVTFHHQGTIETKNNTTSTLDVTPPSPRRMYQKVLKGDVFLSELFTFNRDPAGL